MTSAGDKNEIAHLRAAASEAGPAGPLERNDGWDCDVVDCKKTGGVLVAGVGRKDGVCVGATNIADAAEPVWTDGVAAAAAAAAAADWVG